jgi:hypothetical protein
MGKIVRLAPVASTPVSASPMRKKCCLLSNISDWLLPEIVFLNSHDGTSAHFMLILRCQC